MRPRRLSTRILAGQLVVLLVAVSSGFLLFTRELRHGIDRSYEARARSLPALLGYSALALLLGIAVSLLLARRLKRQTFGLELDEIAQLLQEREAMLHGVSEGVITIDARGRVSLVNEGARRLLNLGTTALHSTVEELLPPGRLRDLMTGAAGEAVDET